MKIFDTIKSFLSGTSSVDDPSDKETYVTSFNSQGEKNQVTQSTFRNNVLPKMIEKAWSDPDELYQLIVEVIHERFFEDVVAAAEHLIQIDSVTHRSYNILGLIYLHTNALEKAEQILKKGISISEYKAVLTTNLAKVYSAQGHEQKAMETLWNALILDPNQDKALLWFASAERDRNPEFGLMLAYTEVSKLPGSWRAQISIAQFYLKALQFEAAKALHKSVLETASDEPDAFMAISGDLAVHKRFDDVFDLIIPIFNIDKHGPKTAMNLINVCIDTRRKEVGIKIFSDFKDHIHKNNRFDLLSFVDIFENKLQDI